MVMWLMYRVLVDKRATYQEDDDNCAILPMVICGFVLAAILHADMNARPVFDTLWMAGLFVGVFSVLPQLAMVARTGGIVDALTSHYIAMMAVSRILSGTFMWHARFDVT